MCVCLSALQLFHFSCSASHNIQHGKLLEGWPDGSDTFLSKYIISLWAQFCIYLILGNTSWLFLACPLCRFPLFQWQLHVTHHVVMLVYSELKMKLRNTYMYPLNLFRSLLGFSHSMMLLYLKASKSQSCNRQQTIARHQHALIYQRLDIYFSAKELIFM